MSNFILKLRSFFAGRNGIDKLTIGLLVLYCIIVGIKTITHLYLWLGIVQALLLAYILFRILSKNLQKRYSENFKFEQFLKAWKPYYEHLKLRIKFFKTHRFRTCKNCGEFLRLKKNRGHRKVSCPKCGRENSYYILF